MKKLFLMSGVLLSASAMAQGIQVGTPAIGGTGCPAGTAHVAVTNNNTAVSILFDQYIVEAGRPTNRRLDRKSCNIAVPIQVPNGFSAAIFQVDYRGFNSLPVGGTSEFNVEYFYAGSQGPRYTRAWRGAIDDEYLVRNTLLATNMVWSPCGQQVILRSNSSMKVQTNTRNDQALATVDSADIQAGLIYHFQLRRCR